MADASWRLISKIFEPEGVGMDYPVVVHTMYGQSAEEAQGYYDSHMESDSFLRQCVEDGNFEGQFKCVERHELAPTYVRGESPPSIYAIAGVYEGIPGSWFRVITGTLQRSFFIAPGMYLAGIRGSKVFTTALLGSLTAEVVLFGYYGLRRAGVMR